jgi:DNA invertase Pin-like site-specific DNA recombinase
MLRWITTKEPSTMPKKPASPTRVAIYSRVSTDHQTTENQERELQAIAERIGWTVVKVYRDQGVSGAKPRQDRPAFDALCKDASRRQFDLIAAWSVDRLGRSLQDLVGFLTEIHALGVNLFLHQQGIDTTTPAGKALFQMMGVFAEFERAMIQDRVKAGLERAKAQGKVLGRPSTDAWKVEAIKADLKAGGVGIIKLAKRHGVGTGTVQRIKAQLKAA